jgi:hypothetical protein
MIQMKKIIQLLFLSLIIVLGACNKDEIHNTDTQIGHSRVTFFPQLTLKGEKFIAVAKGDTYTDPGYEASEAGQTIQATVAPAVNTATPGVYSVVYTATNKDGFSSQAYRIVIVYDTDATAAAQDLSGNWARTLNGSVATFTKLAPGVYKVFNPGGAPGTNVTVAAINPSADVLQIPTQLIAIGNPFGSSDETLDYASDPKTFTWTIDNSGYGTAPRTFNKQ